MTPKRSIRFRRQFHRISGREFVRVDFMQDDQIERTEYMDAWDLIELIASKKKQPE